MSRASSLQVAAHPGSSSLDARHARVKFSELDIIIKTEIGQTRSRHPPAFGAEWFLPAHVHTGCVDSAPSSNGTRCQITHKRTPIALPPRTWGYRLE